MAGKDTEESITTANVSAEAIKEQEDFLGIDPSREADVGNILISSKLSAEYVRPEQDLLAFSASQLHDTVGNFDASRKHLMLLEG